eukprot:PRCOL_00001164-RA
MGTTASRALFSPPNVKTSTETLADFKAKDIDGNEVELSKYKGNVVLMVNVAFPCNQFGGQEPGSNADVKAFAQSKGAEYPLFAKIDVNGPDAHPLWKWAKECKGSLPTSDIKWNFGKFLLDKDGKVYERYAPTSSPMSIEGDIKKLL